MPDWDVLERLIATIEPALEPEGEAARRRLAERSGAHEAEGSLGRLALRLVAARHQTRPRIQDRAILVCAADHGFADPGAELGALQPTAIGVRHLASGEGALGAAARRADASVVLVDVGVRGGDRLDLGPGVLSFRIGDGTADATRGPAMSPEEAIASVQTGVALVYSLADAGLDVLALGQIGGGAAEAAAAVACALTGADPALLEGGADGIPRRALAANGPRRERPLEVLAAVGGFDLGVLAGAILGAASVRVPVILDDHATSAAALIAVRLNPHAAGYLVAAHGGGAPAHRLALSALSLAPLLEAGLSHGEGTGAAFALPMVEAAAAVLAEL